MEKIQINKNNYGTLREKINVKNMYTDNIYLYMFVDGFCTIKAGDFIQFDRAVYSEYSNNNVPIASKRKTVVYVKYNEDSNETFIVINAEDKTLLRIDNIVSENDYYITTFENIINIFAQDIVFAKNKGLTPTIQIYNPQDNSFTDIVSEIYFNETDMINGKKNYEFLVSGCQTPEEFIYDHYNQVDYNDCDRESINPNERPMYYYLPFKTNNNVLSFKEDLTSYIGQNLFYKYNPFYCQGDEALELAEISGITVYECYLWEDIERGDLGPDNLDKYNNISIDKVIDFWGVSVGLTSDIDYRHLYQEKNVTELYTAKVKERVIGAASVIDMEKMKFIPYCNDEMITAVTYDLHFRQRDLEDNWSFVDDADAYWNPKVMDEESGSGSTLTPEELPGAVFSDMLYYLGFTDSDVQNQKQKIRKSFLRLSFYTTPDPLTQKLIYYSSIFMDSGELFGKYIKAKNELVRKGESGDNVVLNSQESEKYRLDCTFTVRNEFYTTKSSDGFNIYYFPDDVSEISGKTIYMKVEFNHAGYGRTIPMIMWPDNGLTMDEIKQGALYIPLTLNILEDEDGKKKYIYEFQEGTYIIKDGNKVVLNLVEPKLLD